MTDSIDTKTRATEDIAMINTQELNKLKIAGLRNLATALQIEVKGDKRKRSTFINAIANHYIGYAKLQQLKVTAKSASQVISELETEFNGYIPLYAYRGQLPHLTREQQDIALYELENRGKIELQALQEVRFYSDEQREAGIPQDIGGSLFYIQTELGIATFI